MGLGGFIIIKASKDKTAHIVHSTSKHTFLDLSSSIYTSLDLDLDRITY